jgi:AcrR family transcriptional regulator
VSTAWSRHDDPDDAAGRILEAAEQAFRELGVAKAGMAEIADLAGCSRGTLYRYFKTRHDLHLAYVERVAPQIAARVRARVEGVADPRERLVEGMLAALREVRRRPATLAWFEASAVGRATHMARASELIETIATTFVDELLGSRPRGRERRARARWLVRAIVSLLTNPGDDEAEERMIVERFVAPGLLAGAAP